ncbi:MAG: hypothetical protein Fur0022_21080 [Anaerolineales bacterium]
MFGRFRRKNFFPFWIFLIFFFFVTGKADFWAWMLPFFLIWMFGPMLWAMVSGERKWEDNGAWKPSRNPIPPQWQAPPPEKDPWNTPYPTESSPKPQPSSSFSQPSRSTAGLPTTCPACGGPINPTTLNWRSDAPHCGYCGISLK